MSNVDTLAFEARVDDAFMLTLWEAVERLVRLWASRYHTSGVTRLYDADDLTQAAYLALHDAVQGYDSTQASFTTYLHLHIRRRFAEVSGHRGTKHRPELCAVSLDVPLAEDETIMLADAIPDPDAERMFDCVTERIQNDQLHAALEECLSRLPQTHADMLRARYYDERTLSSIAAERGIKVETVRQTVSKALRTMHRAPIRKRLDGFYEARHVGLREFRSTHTSAPEAWLLRREELEQRRGERP